ncbi:helix-turn-helix domain-containing protein [Agrobacterium sp. 22-223-1]
MVKDLKELTREQVDAEEDALIDFQFALMDAMKLQGMTKAELAEVLGVSRARISQLFSPSANPTLKLAARALHAVGLKNCYQAPGNNSESKGRDDSEGSYALIDTESFWLGEVVMESPKRKEDVDVNTMKWFACQRQSRKSGAWHQKEARVANSNGTHAMEAA